MPKTQLSDEATILMKKTLPESSRVWLRIALTAGTLVLLVILAILNNKGLLFSRSGFLPHGVCYTWMPGVLQLHVVSDLLIGLAYFAIPAVLVYFVRRRRDLPFNWLLLLFGAFIISCGTTHFVEVLTLWYPYYWLSGVIKLVTAVVSIGTALALMSIMPKALQVPSIEQMEAEVEERRRVEEALRQTQAELEQRVVARTAELEAVHARLQNQQKWWQATVESIGDGVITVDNGGQILLVNNLAGELTGWSEQDAIGQPLAAVLQLADEHGLPLDTRILDAALAEEGTPAPGSSLQLINRDGQTLPVALTATPIRDASGARVGCVVVLRDIRTEYEFERQRQALTQDLASAQALFDTVFTQAPLGLALFDLDLRFIRVNEALAQINGIPQEEHLGRTVEELLPDVEQAVSRTLRTVAETGEHVIGHEVSGMTPAENGRLRAWSVSYFPIRFNGRISALGVVCEEITDKKEAERERMLLLEAEREARAEAEAANRLKDEFLATVSHELRTPLHSMLGWLHLIESNKLPPEEVKKAIGRIHNNARTQTKLIDDLLDVSRIVAGKLRLEARSVDPYAITRAAIDTVRAAAEARGIRIDTHFDESGIKLMADPDRLQQIIWNLLSNAVKFTPDEGQIDVSVRKLGAQLEISIADTGQGIPPEYLPLIFERFRQSPAGSKRKLGLGLGLAIVRQLVQMHGGTVSAHSEGVDKGATFTVRLPIVVQPGETPMALEQTDSAAATPAGGPKLAGLRLFVVDDETDAREVVVKTLTGFGAEVWAADSVEAALSQLERQQPDVLISDIGLPELDGYDLVRELRRREKEEGRRLLPAIALTAYGRPEDRLKALAAGFQLHLSKAAVGPEELAEHVLEVLHSYGSGRQKP